MSDWGGVRVLVTGAAGFIGSHLTERLVHEGAEVRALIRYNSMGRRGHLDGLDANVQSAIDVHAATVEDPAAVRRAVAGTDVVFHLAALIGIPYSYIAPHHYITTNVVGTLHVLEACLREGVQKLVHTSTSETYGSARYVPIDEAHPIIGQSPYSASKIGADQLAISYNRSFELPVAVLRPFNTYGPRQSQRAIIPTIASQLLSGADAVRIGSASPRRDLTYVADTVAGFLGIAACDEAIGQVLNIGSGRSISIGELAQRMIALSGRDVPLQEDTSRIRPSASEVMHLHADISRAATVFGYTPQVSLDQGLQATMDWIGQNLDAYRPAEYAV